MEKQQLDWSWRSVSLYSSVLFNILSEGTFNGCLFILYHERVVQVLGEFLY